MEKIYSEVQHYIEVKRVGDKVQLQNKEGVNYVMDLKALEQMVSADEYSKTVTINKTDLNTLIMQSKGIVMTINFNKKDVVKTDKLYKEELREFAAKYKETVDKKGTNAAIDLLPDVPRQKVSGENRTIRGYHNSDKLNSNGYLDFIDMEEDKTGKRYLVKQVNTETCWAIIRGTKYIVK